MWGCNWGYPFANGGWFMGHGPFGFLMGILLIGIAGYLIVAVIRTLLPGRKINRDTGDSLEIIKNKFARGEITEEEYLRIKDILMS